MKNQMKMRKYGNPEHIEYFVVITIITNKTPMTTHLIRYENKDQLLNFLNQHKQAREFFKNQTSSVNLTKYEPYSLRWLVTRKHEICIIKNTPNPTLNNPRPTAIRKYRSVLLENIETQNENR